MPRKLKPQEYATLMQLNVSTVYRHIKAGKLDVEVDNGTTYIILNESQLEKIETQSQPLLLEKCKIIERLESEVQYLRDELSKAYASLQAMQQDAAEAQQRSDTIILQLTRQFEQQTKLLEDMRPKDNQKKSFFRRLFRKD